MTAFIEDLFQLVMRKMDLAFTMARGMSAFMDAETADFVLTRDLLQYALTGTVKRVGLGQVPTPSPS